MITTGPEVSEVPRLENRVYLHGDAHGVAEVDDDEGGGDHPLLPREVDPTARHYSGLSFFSLALH